MAYLAAVPIVHRDIAARNILVRADPTSPYGVIVRVTDLGLARDTAAYQQQTANMMLPVRWMAPETLQQGSAHGFTEASDVYSFGVTLWEIFSNGQVPFADIETRQLLAIQAQYGLILPRPAPDCPKTTFALMLDCTQRQPASRPSFSAIAATLTTHLTREQDSDLTKKSHGHAGISAQKSDLSYADPASEAILVPANLQYVTASNIDSATSLCETYDRL